jgi:hypothetical protein
MSKHRSGLIMYPHPMTDQISGFNGQAMNPPAEGSNKPVHLSQKEADAIESYAKAAVQLQKKVEMLCTQLTTLVERLEKIEKLHFENGKRFS